MKNNANVSNNGVSFGDFHLDTIANFQKINESELPNRTPDFISESGSKYWHEGDTVIRQSDHWGAENMDSCNWMLGYSSHKGLSQGKCKLAHFKRKNTVKMSDFEDSEKSRNFTNNTTKNEIRNIISGLSEVTSGTAIQTASNYLRNCFRAKTEDRVEKKLKLQEADCLKPYITENNFWVSVKFIKSRTHIGAGAEQEAYLLDQKNVIKINDAIFYGSWQEYFNSLLLHNYFFPMSSYELIGFTEEDDRLFAVVKQPFVEETEKTDLKEVKKFLSDNGFENTRDNDYYNPELEIVLEDLHDENVLTKDGILHFIDTVFYNRKLTKINPDKFHDGGKVEKPSYLMTLDEYQKTVTPILTEYNKFIKKNDQHLASTDYGGIFYYTFPELLSDVKKGIQKGFMFRKGEYDKGLTDEQFSRQSFSYRKTGKWDKEYEPEPIPEGLTEKKNEYIDKLSNYFTEEEIVRLIDKKDEVKSNKRSVKRAIDNNTYKKLLEEGKVTLEDVEKVAESVGVRLPKKIFSESTIKAKENKALYDKIYASMPSVNKEVLSKMVDDIKETFKPLEKIIYERETERYKDKILQTLNKKEADIYILADWLRFHKEIFNYENQEERRKDISDKFGNRVIKTDWIVGLSLKDNWEEIVSKYVLEEIEELKVNMIYSIIINFQKITQPIENIEQLSLEVGKKGFQGEYRFNFKNGSSFIFKTEAVGAGGYNIQRYHFRYLTNFTDVTLADGSKESGSYSVIQNFSLGKGKNEFVDGGIIQKKHTEDKILNSFMNELNNKNSLQRNPFNGREFIYDEKASLEFSRFDKKDRNEIELKDIAVFEKSQGIGNSVMKDITDVADKLGTTLTLHAKPFGNDVKGLNKKELINFYKKHGFETKMDRFASEFKNEDEMIKYILKHESESLAMIRKPIHKLDKNKFDNGGNIQDWNLIKKGTYSGIAGGTMGTISNKYIAGQKNTYKYSHYTIEEFIPRKDLKQDHSISYHVFGFKNEFKLPLDKENQSSHTFYIFKNKIDWDKIREFEQLGYEQMIDKVKRTDTSKAVEFINKNNMFNQVVEHKIKNENKQPYLAFIETIRDFYRYSIPYPFSSEVISNMAMEKGMNITSLDDINNIIYNKETNFKDGGDVFSASSRFRPYETISFNPPIVGVNGAKLISYTWAYEWQEEFDARKGEPVNKRISNWDSAIASADTGKNIVHQFEVQMPNGENKTVSSESVLIALGYVQKEQLKSFPSLVNSLKTLAKQRIQLSLMEAQQKQYDELRIKFEKSDKPQITIATLDQLPTITRFMIEKGDSSTTFFAMGDVVYGQGNESVYDSKEGKSRYIPAEVPNRTTKEQLNYFWVDARIKENDGSRPNGLYDLKNRVKRQESKVKQITEQTSMETKKFADGGKTDDYENVSVDYLNSIRTQSKSNWNHDLEKSIEKQGITEPVTITYHVHDGKVTLSDGHNRLDTAIELGIKEIPTKVKLYYGNYLPSNSKDVPIQQPDKKDLKPSDLGIYKNGGGVSSFEFKKNLLEKLKNSTTTDLYFKTIVFNSGGISSTEIKDYGYKIDNYLLTTRHIYAFDESIKPSKTRTDHKLFKEQIYDSLMEKLNRAEQTHISTEKAVSFIESLPRIYAKDLKEGDVFKIYETKNNEVIGNITYKAIGSDGTYVDAEVIAIEGEIVSLEDLQVGEKINEAIRTEAFGEKIENFAEGGEAKPKKVIRRNLPINKEYKLIDSFYTGGLEENPMTCENCGRPIANVAVIQDSESKTYDVGMDCAETLASIKNSLEFIATQNDFKEATAIRNKIRKSVKEGTIIQAENTFFGKIYISGKKDGRMQFNIPIYKVFLFKYLPDFKKDIINPDKNNFNPKYFDNYDFGFNFIYFKDKIVAPKEFTVGDYTVIVKRMDIPNYMEDGVTVRNINNHIVIEIFKDGLSVGTNSTYMHQDVPRYIINTVNKYEFENYVENKFTDGGSVEDLKLQIMRLQTKAFKSFPNSPQQNKIKNEIAELYKKLEEKGGSFKDGGDLKIIQYGDRVTFINDSEKTEGKLPYLSGNSGHVVNIYNKNGQTYYTVKRGMTEDEVPASAVVLHKKDVREKVEEILTERQQKKGFKDIGKRVSGSQKEKVVLSSIITLSDLKAIEEDEMTAIKTVVKEKVYPEVNIEEQKALDVTSGAVYIKIETRKACGNAPPNDKKKRASYVKFINKFTQDTYNTKTVQEIRDIYYSYEKWTPSEIIGYFIDPSFLESSDEIKAKLEKFFTEKFRFSASRVVKILVTEIFGKRLANFMFGGSDTASQTWQEAKSFEPISKEESDILIEKEKERKHKLIEVNKQKVEHFKNATTEVLKSETYNFSFGATWKKLFKEDIENFRKWAVEYYQRRVDDGIKSLDVITPSIQQRENNWEWYEKNPEKRVIERSKEIQINSGKPLAFIKRIGGVKIDESYVDLTKETDLTKNPITNDFGFKTVQFGQSLHDKSAKEHIRHFLGAMSDMSELLGINIKSLNKIGDLSIAFASRGKRGALAHFEAGRKIINITNKRGDGTINHEYFHYIDNALTTVGKEGISLAFGSDEPEKILNKNVAEKIKAIMDFIHKGKEGITAPIKVLFKKEARSYSSVPKFYSKKTGTKEITMLNTIDETIELLRSEYPDIVSMNTKYPEYQKSFFGYIINHFELNEYEVPLSMTTSNFYYGSEQMSSAYWIRPHELFARASETYMYDKLIKNNRFNNYLVNEEMFAETMLNSGEMANVYPYGKEREHLYELYDNFIETVKSEYNLSSFVPISNKREDEYLVLEENQEVDENVDAGIVVDAKTDKVEEVIHDNKDVEFEEKVKAEFTKKHHNEAMELAMQMVELTEGKEKEDWQNYIEVLQLMNETV